MLEKCQDECNEETLRLPFTEGSEIFNMSQSDKINYVTNTDNDFFEGIRQKISIDKINSIANTQQLMFYGMKKGVLGENISYTRIIELLSQFGEIFEERIDRFYIIHEDYIISMRINIKNGIICYKARFITSSRKMKQKVEDKLENIETSNKYSICPIKLFTTSWNGAIIEIHIEETINETVYEEAYPFIRDGNINEYIEDFLESDESVLIFLGDVGTGKTKLVRHLLRTVMEKSSEALSARSHDIFNCNNFNVFYTTTHKSLESDELFNSFVSESAILVLEDIDFHLRNRQENNSLMYKLLAFSDGLITSDNKIIISTNAKLDDIDSALIRPGRCFDLAEFRKLTREESNVLLERLGKNEKLEERRDYSLSEVYRFYNTGKLSNQEQGRKKGIKKTGFM